mmetsp:Transcript_15649/g.23507  ORF Transcript_15649/g.23507 Transcript_15649/m.23507 type:complete len:80 (+) Transcript_15649:31-270(+)
MCTVTSSLLSGHSSCSNICCNESSMIGSFHQLSYHSMKYYAAMPYFVHLSIYFFNTFHDYLSFSSLFNPPQSSYRDKKH